MSEGRPRRRKWREFWLKAGVWAFLAVFLFSILGVGVVVVTASGR